MLDIPFTIIPSDFEEIVDENISPEKNAELLAKGKALNVFEHHLHSYVVGVDTLVVSDQGKILGKPKNENEAQQMFRNASDTTQTIISGIALAVPSSTNSPDQPHKVIVRHEVANVTFTKLTESDIDRLLSLNEWHDTSGGISIEGKSGVYIERIQGNLWNIIGFPVITFGHMLQKLS